MGTGTFGEVYPANIRGAHRPVAVKMMDRTDIPDAALELRRCVAVAGHPDIVQVLDVALFDWNPTGLDQPRIALIFERFATSVGGIS